jgi:hypothetical protein
MLREEWDTEFRLTVAMPVRPLSHTKPDRNLLQKGTGMMRHSIVTQKGNRGTFSWSLKKAPITSDFLVMIEGRLDRKKSRSLKISVERCLRLLRHYTGASISPIPRQANALSEYVTQWLLLNLPTDT